MTQRSFHWNGASLGDADALTLNVADGIGFRLANENYESPFVDRGLRMLLNGDENRGVLPNWLNELEVTGVATPVQVDTGGAIVYGMPYENTAAVNVAVPNPTSDTRQDYIVLRRNWADQEIRITRIEGTEGGSVPAITQSPAPSGTGIYDIPLATLSITTGGVITVTDAREYCRFGGGPGEDSLDTAQLNNDSVTLQDREIRTCRQFIGGGCFASQGTTFQYTSGGAAIGMSGATTWDGGGNEQGWQLNAATYYGVSGKILVPPHNYASGDITTYIWWTPNGALASTFYIRSAWQLEAYYWSYARDYSGTYSSVYINETTVANNFYRTQGDTLDAADIAQIGSLIPAYPYADLNYLMYWYNSAGAEDINLLGVEFVYQGYV